jgi:sarcosine oxidase subunit delta
MSFMLSCPNCGAREPYEFRYGGQILSSDATSPGLGGTTTQNLPERQRELWYHRLGCRRWIVAERDVRTNDVVSTGWLAEGKAP